MTVGAADATLTQILSGVKVGQTVVIATITSTIPSSTTGTGRSLTGGRWPSAVVDSGAADSARRGGG